MNNRVLFLICSCFLTNIALAHGPTPQKVLEEMTVDQPIEKVWQTLKSFCDIQQWHSEIKQCEIFTKDEDAKTQYRRITLNTGETFSESLDFVDDEKHEINFRLADTNLKALPISSHSSSIQLSSENNGQTLVKWKSRFYRGDTSNFPPDNLNDEAAVAGMKSFVDKTLQGLKESMTN